MSKIILSLLLMFIGLFCSIAQTDTTSRAMDIQSGSGQPVFKSDDTIGNLDEDIFYVVEQKPEFVGGEEARINYLAMNINYPLEARTNGVQGTVYVTFVIEKTGKVTNVKILRGIGSGCDEEVVRLIKAMPDWKPGMQGGKPVRVQFNMPIKFNIGTITERE